MECSSSLPRVHVLGLAAVLLLWSAGCGGPPSLEEARSDLERGRFAAAEQKARDALAADGQSVSWRLLAAQASWASKDQDRCVEHLRSLAEPVPPEFAVSLAQLAHELLFAGRLTAAERALSLAVQAEPSHLPTRADLAYLLGLEGRCAEAVPHLLEAVKRGEFSLHHLVLLGASDPVIDDPGLVGRAADHADDKAISQLGAGRTAVRQDQWDTARGILEPLVRQYPECGEAQAQLGRLLQATASEEYSGWSERVPKAAEANAGVWVARGLGARSRGELRAAVRCFGEALARDSENRVANLQLALCLAQLGEASSTPFARRAERLQELALCVDEVYRHPDRPELRRQAAELTESLGRVWEARAWAMSATGESQPPWATDLLARTLSKIDARSPRVLAAESPIGQLDFAAYPLPDFSRAPSGPAPMLPSSSRIRFADRALETGLEFVYHTRANDDRGELRMYETTGGGVAVFDMDRDDRPDLYFTQGGALKGEDQSPAETDRLFRQTGSAGEAGSAGWTDVTFAAGLAETAYGQGVSSGDWNNDGFPDLYVGNLGVNRLLLNCGDGTFEDASSTLGERSPRWTTSCLMADLDGDGDPDLYDVNYVQLDDAVRATCRHGEELRWCSPDAFAAEGDVLRLSSGDGTVRDVTAGSGIDVPNGKGLGIVAADFEETGRLSLFIANDAVPNFFFVPTQSSDRESPITYQELASERGLAVDENGLAQACMGVAAGDLDGDRKLDLFVTNFYDESNTAYLQRSQGVFLDETRAAKLREPSLKQLGFGTQCLDADLDGALDLVVTNGHVLDLRAGGTPYDMPSQFFVNGGAGVFQEISDSAGPLFQERRLGRGLARLDWNGDGREDFVVTNIGTPAVLAENRSDESGHVIGIRLVGRQCSRDAVGSIVSYTVGGIERVRHLVGGDGYQCSNERRIHLGLGRRGQADEVKVRWSSGRIQSVSAVQAGQELVWVEGEEPLPRPLRRR